MAKYKSGILGQFSGAVGPVVGSSWKGIDYMRSKGGPVKKPASEKQVAQRARLGKVSKFTTSMRALLDKTFIAFGQHQTGCNHAFKLIFHKAVRGQYPDFELVYPSILVSKGTLTNVSEGITKALGPTIVFSWPDNTGVGNAEARDKVILVAYCEELQQAVYSIGTARRSDATGVLDAPAFAGKEVHTWISFFTEDESEVATSIYTGVVDM